MARSAKQLKRMHATNMGKATAIKKGPGFVAMSLKMFKPVAKTPKSNFKSTLFSKIKK